MADDLLGLGKVMPIDKLIDVISKATASVTQPYIDRRNIRTKAYELEILIASEIKTFKLVEDAIKHSGQEIKSIEYKDHKINVTAGKIDKYDNLPSVGLTERIESRLSYTEARNQLNIESITAYAAEQLKDKPAIDNTPFDEGWAGRFFDSAKHVSDEEIQMLWGRILAGEVMEAASFSLRTLDLIKNLSKADADLIKAIADFTFRVSNDTVFFSSHCKTAIKKWH